MTNGLEHLQCQQCPDRGSVVVQSRTLSTRRWQKWLGVRVPPSKGPIGLATSPLSVHVCMLSCFSYVQLLVTPRTAAHQAPLSMRFSRQEYWSGLPFPPSGDLSKPGIESSSLTSPALAGSLIRLGATLPFPLLGPASSS